MSHYDQHICTFLESTQNAGYTETDEIEEVSIVSSLPQRFHDLSVLEAQNFIEHSAYIKGTTCPTCGQFVKLYPRILDATMMTGLFMLYRLPRGMWVHMNNYFLEFNKYLPSTALLRWWGILERQMDQKEDGNPRNGFYRITRRGHFFVQNKISASAWCYLFNNACFGFSEKRSTFQEAKGKKFNYDSLMGKLHSVTTFKKEFWGEGFDYWDSCIQEEIDYWDHDLNARYGL